ncbi:inactive serine/threonine-protein kinase At1g67470 [Capsella rubella]|uniref:inactive serine/threonine-protein kinase At1g67470 n=1 Tax=Capsella rubella TaxID=81985 RepID=UPI000CD5BAAD|nr:inactive serine/threonine-protein kinase At1g67470 [Capsella rubella]
MKWWWRRKRNKKLILANKRGAKLLEDLIECCDGKSNSIKFFSAHQILKATDYFSHSNLVALHDWYSGKNENHRKILVRKFNRNRDGRICRDIAVSSMVSGHKNFMKLVGCCLECENPVMVYDDVKKHYELDISRELWERRMKIAEDIAIGLAYLHTAFPRPFVYRSFSDGNILLDEDGVAKLTGFSFCVSIPQGETFVKVDVVAGTLNYMDEKYYRNLVVSEETDVFAFGILMLRLLTGDERFLKYDDDEEEGEADDDDEEGEADDDYEEGEAGDEGYDDDNKSYHSAAMSEINDQRRQFSEETDSEEEGEAVGEEDDLDDYATMVSPANPSYFRRFKFIEERRMDEVIDPEMLEKMGEISEEELSQMKAFKMLSLRCIGHKGEIPTIVEVAKELKKIQRSLNTTDSSYPSGETQLNFAQDMSSTVVLSNQTTNT